MYIEAMLFAASFGAVFFLALNSKILRDDHFMLGGFVSWLITASQYALTWVVVHAAMDHWLYLLLAGAGGSLGTTLAQYTYRWLETHHLPIRRKTS